MTTFLPILSLVVPANRQRREFDQGELNELRESIERLGLLHAIVVRLDVDSQTPVLVAGERRLRAVSDLWGWGGTFSYNGEAVPAGCIPATNLQDLSPLEIMEAEYEENVRRSDLTWQEKATAAANLVALREAQAASAGLAPPTKGELAKEVQDAGGPAAVKQHLMAARFLDDPDVRKAATVADAVKVIKRKEAVGKAKALGAALGGEVVAARHTLIRGDCLEWLRKLHAHAFDVVLSDPPYGMGADGFGDSGGKTAGSHFYADDPTTWLHTMESFCALSATVSKPDAHCYLFCDIEKFPVLREMMQAAGWEVFRTPLIWYKPAAYRAPWPTQGPQRKYEAILYAVKGGLRTTKMAGDVLEFQPDTNVGHQAQKPVALFTELLRRSCVPGMKVLDAFCGSGPIFPAAQECKVFATGIEQDEMAYGLAAARLQQLKDGV